MYPSLGLQPLHCLLYHYCFSLASFMRGIVGSLGQPVWNERLGREGVMQFLSVSASASATATASATANKSGNRGAGNNTNNDGSILYSIPWDLPNIRYQPLVTTNINPI